MRGKFDVSSDQPDPTRRLLLRSGGALCALTCMKASSETKRFEWKRIDPESAGFARELPEQLDQGVASGALTNLHAVIIVRHGNLVVERYYKGQDESWGQPFREVTFNADTLHDIRSITKSIVSLLYGIALSEGKVPGVETPIANVFTAYPELVKDERKRHIKIVHALTMTMGLEWNEDLPIDDPRNSQMALEASQDRYRYLLTQRAVANPGEKWQYCGGATEILGHLIARGTGMPILEYARKKLFLPLGIENVVWNKGDHDEEAAAWGLRMRPLDLARIGQLVLQRGEWNGARIVPANWLTESMIPRVDGWPDLRYGYQWHLFPTPSGSLAYWGLGLGGQRLVISPERESVSVIHMGNYYRADQVELSFAVRKLINAATR